MNLCNRSGVNSNAQAQQRTLKYLFYLSTPGGVKRISIRRRAGSSVLPLF